MANWAELPCPHCGKPLPERGTRRVRVPTRGGRRLHVHVECAREIHKQGALDLDAPTPEAAAEEARLREEIPF